MPISTISTFFGVGESSATPILKEGEYKVDEDMETGKYYVVCNSYNMYIAVFKDSGGTLDNIIYNLNTEGCVYITLKEGEYLEVTGGKLYNLSDNPYSKPKNGILPEGVYKVGEDIAPAEYTLDTTNSGYVEITTKNRHALYNIVTNGNFETNKIIGVSEGQLFYLIKQK